MTTQRNFESEIRVKSWLEFALKNEKVKKFSVKILGSSEKGDGYLGDIVFVSANGITENDSLKKFELVLKCSKRSEALRQTLPVKEAFLNEIFIYENVIPCFYQFQRTKGVGNIFNSVPKCYGTVTGENMEVIIFENLKNSGYKLWPKQNPLTRKHIDVVVTEYAKFHATSLALQHQQPEKFREILHGLTDVFAKFVKTSAFSVLFRTPINESYELLKDELDENTLLKWKNLKTKIDYILNIGELENVACLKVILHGDCWNNNFMFLHSDDDKRTPLKVAFLDWQTTRYSSPILDLSYFLFACMAEDHFSHLNDILKTYYNVFVTQLTQLGIEKADKLYSLDRLLSDWNNYCIFGILLASLIMKVVSTDKDEVIDIAQVAESEKTFSDAFSIDIRNKENYRKRIRPIVLHAVKHNLI